ncbi:MAG TPA: GTP pyrophosphokinase [Candidatus Aphodocola excrementigallinarum]|uniref:GTP pyrophosphokinase n=1 Tax=Candidatus Aphodocola excrementigallinarum TaxID=2840670 RepID=A0A9D1IQW2_9FIRM|nr:GTP pyrophosphokinase [Candidatus Aphodocola excrementigallinarum]
MLKEYLLDEKYDELRKSDDLIYKALELSTILFKGSVDKGGYPYVLHLLYVYSNVDTKEEKVIALLHDVMEDKKVTKEELLDIGFPLKIVNDLAVLTRVKPMEYTDYIDNIIKNGSKEALNVKLADLENNIDLTRIKNPSVKDYERVERRYIPSHEKILNRLKEME